MTDISEMKLFPYLGRSKNLIELFCIIGYDENELSDFAQNISEIESNLKISLISDIISDLAYENFDINDIISQVYPSKPNIYQDMKNGIPNPTSVVFSYFFDATFYSCYAFKFYEKFKMGETDYFLPKAFVIISEYPYFASFYIICSKIYKMNICKQNVGGIDGKSNINKIPVEIFIHCLVNYTPSPLDKNIALNIFPNNKIFIPRLTGYPYVDFDICNLLFNKDKPIKIKNFIKVYLLMFLEIDLLIFCPDHERLNLIMCLLVNLNYPLIDSEYSKHIKSISKKKLPQGFDVPYGTFRGVITNYDSVLDLSNFRDLNFIVEVENKMEIKNIENEEEQNKDAEDKNKLLDYFNKIYNYKTVNSSFLSNYITILRTELKKISKEYTKMKNNNSSFFNINEEIIKFNKKIQEAFYNFNLNILKIMYNDYKLDTTKFEIINNNEKKDNDYSEEEIIFMKEFRKTTRANKYYESFVKNFESVDELRFSHIFSDNVIINLKKDTSKFDNFNNYFDLMDKLYNDQEEKENNKICVIDYDYLFKDFKEFYQEKIEQKIKKIKNNSKNQLFALNKKIINEFLYYKNNKELFKSLKDKEKNMIKFEIKRRMFIPKTIEFIHINHINEEADNKKTNNEEIINNNDINDEYWINGSLIFIFCIVFPLFSHSSINIYLKDLLINTLKKMKYFQRYYIEIILRSIYYYYLNNEEIGLFPDLTLENIKNYYNIILNKLIIKNSIIPNEEIIFFLKKILLNDNKNNKDNKDNEIKNENEIKQVPRKNIFQYDKELEETKIINQNSIIKKDDNFIFIYDKKEKKFKKISNGKEIHNTIYSVYKDFSSTNFELEKLDFKKACRVILNIYDLTKSKEELSLFLYKSINVLKKLEKILKIKSNK